MNIKDGRREQWHQDVLGVALQTVLQMGVSRNVLQVLAQVIVQIMHVLRCAVQEAAKTGAWTAVILAV